MKRMKSADAGVPDCSFCSTHRSRAWSNSCSLVSIRGFLPRTCGLKSNSMSVLIFKHTHRVTYSDCTAGNHVYYSRFLDLLEAARGEFFRHLGRTFLHWQESGTIFPVTECRLRYLAPA